MLTIILDIERKRAADQLIQSFRANSSAEPSVYSYSSFHLKLISGCRCALLKWSGYVDLVKNLLLHYPWELNLFFMDQALFFFCYSSLSLNSLRFLRMFTPPVPAQARFLELFWVSLLAVFRFGVIHESISK